MINDGSDTFLLSYLVEAKINLLRSFKNVKETKTKWGEIPHKLKKQPSLKFSNFTELGED